MKTLTKKNNFIITVIVTYGDRRNLLKQVLNELKSQDTGRVVLVNNGVTWPLKEELVTEHGDWIDVVEMDHNSGSAVGFAMGIQRAIDLGADFIWLLDDDNRPHIDTLQKLMDAYMTATIKIPFNLLAVVAFRPEHQSDVATGVPLRHINSLPNSFHGFHVKDIPYKIWRRTPWGRPKVRDRLPEIVPMNTVPYSGMLFRRELIDTIGVPNAEFVLYADDLEFTYRITKRGGRTLLVTAAMLDDLESSWNIKAKFSNGFSAQLNGIGDFRAYYSMRNSTFMDFNITKKNWIEFKLNLYIYLFILLFFAILLKRMARYRLLKNAVNDGITGQLGLNKNYPL